MLINKVVVQITVGIISGLMKIRTKSVQIQTDPSARSDSALANLIFRKSIPSPFFCASHEQDLSHTAALFRPKNCKLVTKHARAIPRRIIVKVMLDIRCSFMHYILRK